MTLRASLRVEILAVSLVCGCAGWHRVELFSDTTLAPRQQVQVWEGSESRVLHGVQLARDSLIGVPYHRPTSCDSCRVAIPRSNVDSLRLGSMERAGIVMSALPFLALAFLAWTLSGMGD